MSMANRRGVKVVLPRIGADSFWQDVHAHYAGAEPAKWKALAMLALKENCGWTLDMIGNAFNHERFEFTSGSEARGDGPEARGRDQPCASSNA